jgi:hypothetical protein
MYEHNRVQQHAFGAGASQAPRTRNRPMRKSIDRITVRSAAFQQPEAPNWHRRSDDINTFLPSELSTIRCTVDATKMALSTEPSVCVGTLHGFLYYCSSDPPLSSVKAAVPSRRPFACIIIVCEASARVLQAITPETTIPVKDT